MQPISYARHHFPPDIIRQAVWLYLRFTLSYRDVEELLAERGLDVTHVRTRLRAAPIQKILLASAGASTHVTRMDG